MWIGCRCTILKGVSIADNIVVAANSTITTKLDHSFSCYGRNGVELKSNIEWTKSLILFNILQIIRIEFHELVKEIN